ncbi:MAG TPA: hypothetical protein VKB88_31710 [Bryobacteraceae bacterium]|nr:hypothetical protein [Bryobacteraceae bacterium]
MLAAGVALTLLSAGAVWFVSAHGWTLYYGDAEAHLNIARRIVDSQTPGYSQVGTVWLPLPHWLMLPLVGNDGMWRSGLAGAIPSAVCFVLAGLFLFAAVRRIFNATAAAAAATALFALNPNALYLGSVPMTESAFWAGLLGVLYFTVRGSAVGAGIAACAATLVRYDGWFLLPFVALYFWRTAGPRQVVVFSILGGLGPVYWLGHNYFLNNHPLEFILGPYSPLAIQRGEPYPGLHNWRLSWQYVSTAAKLCAGSVLTWIGVAGIAAALVRRAFWPILLLALPPLFYIWSMHSSGGTPIHVPPLPPYSYYNTRYGLEALPLLALAGGALVALLPSHMHGWAAAAVVAAASLPWLFHPHPSAWVTWEESRVNSEARRVWAREAADYLAPRFHPGSGILTSPSDLRAIFREAGIPFREVFTEDNGMLWLASLRRPCLYLRQEWVVAQQGDVVERAIEANRSCLQYHLEKTIVVKDAAPVKIYRR